MQTIYNFNSVFVRRRVTFSWEKQIHTTLFLLGSLQHSHTLWSMAVIPRSTHLSTAACGSCGRHATILLFFWMLPPNLLYWSWLVLPLVQWIKTADPLWFMKSSNSNYVQRIMQKDIERLVGVLQMQATRSDINSFKKLRRNSKQYVRRGNQQLRNINELWTQLKQHWYKQWDREAMTLLLAFHGKMMLKKKVLNGLRTEPLISPLSTESEVPWLQETSVTIRAPRTLTYTAKVLWKKPQRFTYSSLSFIVFYVTESCYSYNSISKFRNCLTKTDDREPTAPRNG